MEELEHGRLDPACAEEAECGGVDLARAEAAVRELLAAIGEDPGREGLADTPARVARACAEMFSGMREDPSAHLRRQFREGGSGEVVVVRDVPFSSMCEHHLLPFAGCAHVAYVPRDGRVAGLSKIARCVEGYARRLQVQERLTSQVADALADALDPLGALVVVEAEHTCMAARGIRKPGSLTVTSAARRLFERDAAARAEALALLGLAR